MARSRNYRFEIERLEDRVVFAVDAFIYFGPLAVAPEPAAVECHRELADMACGTSFNDFVKIDGPAALTPSSAAAVHGDAQIHAFEIKDFSFGVENPTTIGSATKIDWSGPGDEGPEGSISFVFEKL